MSATPNPVDIHVGSRLRLRRTLQGMTQSTLAKALDLSFQQIQKYERGTNRIGSSRLYQFSQILDAPIAYFFKGAPKVGDPQPRESGGGESRAGRNAAAFQSKRETLELVRAYTRISDSNTRKRLLNVAKAMAKMSSSD